MFFKTSSSCQNVSLSRNCVGGTFESLHPLSFNMISIRWNPEGKHRAPGSKVEAVVWVYIHRATLSIPKSKTSCPQGGSGLRRLSDLYRVRRRRSSIIHKTNRHLLEQPPAFFTHGTETQPTREQYQPLTREPPYSTSQHGKVTENRRCLQRL